MKRILICLLCCSFLICSFTQPIVDTVFKLTHYNEWTKMMESDPNDRWSRHGANQRFQIFDRFSKLTSPKEKLAAHISFYGNAALAWLNGQTVLELAAAGINKANADSFLYHVVVNDSIEIVPWQHPSVFKTNSMGTYAYLGKFESLHKLIKLEIYHTGQYYDKKTVYYNNLYTPAPVIENTLLRYNDPYLFNPHKQHYVPHKKNVQIGGYEYESSSNKKQEIQHRSFEWSDSINHIKLSINPTILNEMYYVYLRHYSNTHADTSFISNQWNISSYSKNPEMIINASYFKKPGNYEVIVTTEIPEEFNKKSSNKQTSLFFSVKPSSIVQFSSKQAIMYTAFLAFVGGTGFFLYRGRNKRQLEKKQQEKEIATLQLRAVRSQLNPHFMFNALAGIQNLVNKNETDKASNYLSKFARITGHILNETEDDKTTIEEEVNLLNDYLLMEQLRFGFQYKVVIDDNIDKIHTAIPSMLLQPLVENAVKHGVSGLSERGMISINFMKQAEELIIQVIDNGPGFSPDAVKEGFGLKLIRERIELLNKLYSQSTVHFDVLSVDGHTACQLTLNHWS
ncbi:MAG: sensor histidine kinase [Sediminibacterium sp.]